MDDYDEETFRRLQLRIRTLTTLLSELDAPGKIVHDRMETMRLARANQFTALCNNLSLLLNTSLSADAIAVAPAAYTINLGLALVGVAQHEEGKPSIEMFRAEHSAFEEGEDEYIQAILDAFHPDANDDRFATLMPLMLTHCRNKIAQSLCFYDALFARPFEHILAECRIVGTETWEVYVNVPDAIAHLMEGIPRRPSSPGGSNDYRLASDNIRQWLAILSAEYAHLRDVFLERSGSDVFNGRCLYFFLTSVLYSDSVLNTLFSRTDLVDRLTNVFMGPADPAVLCELGDTIGDCETFRSMSRNQQVNQLVRACLGTTTSWRRAVIYLIVYHRVSRVPDTVSFCLVRTPKPETKMEDVAELLSELNVDMDADTARLGRLMEMKEFTGSVHNEAFLMALKSDAEAADVDEQAKALFLYGDNDRSIGLAKKPCLCCHLLADELNFKLPGTCGRILPWDPPRGVGVQFLNRLAYTLARKLERVLAKQA